jgi:hypothetical protein
MDNFLAARHGWAHEGIARHPQQEIPSPHPQSPLYVLRERAWVVALKFRIVRPVEDSEARPVEPGQTLLSQNPQRTIVRLEYVPHIIVRQSVLLAEIETPVFIGHRKRSGRGKTRCWISNAAAAEQSHHRKNDASGSPSRRRK